MATFLRLYRLTALISWSAIAATLTIPYQFKSRWRAAKEVTRITHLWSRGVAKIIGLRVRMSGDIPQAAGGLVVSNHLSYVDIITHGSTVPVRYAVRADLAKWPILGWYVGLSRPVWTDRVSRSTSKKTMRDFAKTMNKGIMLVVYPEGTTTDGKSGILPFKSTPFEAAIAGNAPIIPILTRYAQPAGEPTICWYGDMTLLPHAWKILGFPAIEAEIRFLKPIFPEGRTRKELASYVHGVMAAEYANPTALS